jgi:hypothetical protein
MEEDVIKYRIRGEEVDKRNNARMKKGERNRQTSKAGE